MSIRARSQLILGILLILAGTWFLLDKTNPRFHEFFETYTKWPLNMFLIGGLILLVGLFTGSPGLAVPAAIVAGIGGIFYYQELADKQDAWYLWSLVPAFVGVGSIIAGLLGDNPGHNIKRGLNLIVIGVVLFLVLSSFFGGLPLLGAYGPAILLILLGLWVLGSGLVRSFRRNE